MKKTTLIAFLTLATSAVATPIDLGPSQLIRGDYQLAWTPDMTKLDGQTLSIDLTFTNDQFVRLFENTSKSFLMAPCLRLHGTGLVFNGATSSYTLDANGQQNSRTWTSLGGGSTETDDETFNFSLGYVFPMLEIDGTPRTDIEALDFYGFHLEFTLPDTDDFEIVGGNLIFAVNADQRNPWAIGPAVPDSGSTAALLALSVAMVMMFVRPR